MARKRKVQTNTNARTEEPGSQLVIFAIGIALAVAAGYFFQRLNPLERNEALTKHTQSPTSFSAHSDNAAASALGTLLDLHLTTPMPLRDAVPVRAVQDLIARDGSWNPDAALYPIQLAEKAGTSRATSGGLTPLGYAILLRDVALVDSLLFPGAGVGNKKNSQKRSKRCDPTATVAGAAAAPPPPAARGGAPSAPAGGGGGGVRVLGAFHESALGDQLKPLHLALLQKVREVL
jgi:hypothetical protein